MFIQYAAACDVINTSLEQGFVWGQQDRASVET